MPIGLEDRLVNNASGFSIAGAIDNDIRGIYWVANTGTRDTLGDANSNNSDLRAQYVICVVGSTPYIYTSSSIADSDWTNTANWQEFALGDLSQVISDVSANTTAIALNTAKVSADGSIDTHSDVDTSTTAPEIGQVLFWNGTHWVPEYPEVTVEVKNATATNFTKGQPVYVSGTAASGKPEIELADNDGTGTYPSIGLLYDDIDAGAEGLAVISGSIFGLNTSGYAAGDALYLDSTPGALTSTRPSGHTKAVQKVALVKRSHPSAGSVIVMGAGRTNDVPNLQSGYFWRGDAQGVATPADFETSVASTTAVTNNTTKLATIDSGATANPNALDNVVEDTTPQLGGGLDLNGQDITGSGNINITGKATQSGTPTGLQDLTTKAYVDELIAAGIHYHDPVRVESPDSAGSLNATYNNGTAGVGATLTNNGTQAALVIDGVTLSVNDRVLIYNQTNAYENGIYTVTNTGSASTNWVLTRATDADSYGLGNTELSEGTSVFVLEGDDGKGEVYGCTTVGTITFGTTAINFSQIGAAPVYSNATQSVDGLMSSTDKTKLDGIEDSADVTDSANVAAAGAVMESDLAANGQLVIGGTSGAAIATLTQGSNVTITNGDGTITIAANDTNTTYSAGDGIDLTGTTFSVDLVANGGLKFDTGELGLSLSHPGIAGVLGVPNGGTGQSTLASDSVLTGDGTSGIVAESTVKVISGNLNILGKTATQPGLVVFHEASNNGTDSTALAAQTSLSGTNIVYLPASAGTLALTSEVPTNADDLGDWSSVAPSDGDVVQYHNGEYFPAPIGAGNGIIVTAVTPAQQGDPATQIGISSAQTLIQTIYNSGLKIGTSSTDDYIDFSNANTIDLVVNGGAGYVTFQAGGVDFNGGYLDAVTNVYATGVIGRPPPDSDYISFANAGEIHLTTNAITRLEANDSGVEISTLHTDQNVFTKTGNNDHLYQGDVVKFGSGTTIQGDLYYYNSGSWTAANASAVATSGGYLLGIATGTSPTQNGMLIRGMYTLAYDPGTDGDPLYVSTSPGDIQDSAPTGQNHVVRVVGYCLDSTNGQVWFDPSKDYITIA